MIFRARRRRLDLPLSPCSRKRLTFWSLGRISSGSARGQGDTGVIRHLPLPTGLREAIATPEIVEAQPGYYWSRRDAREVSILVAAPVEGMTACGVICPFAHDRILPWPQGRVRSTPCTCHHQPVRSRRAGTSARPPPVGGPPPSHDHRHRRTQRSFRQPERPSTRQLRVPAAGPAMPRQASAADSA